MNINIKCPESMDWDYISAHHKLSEEFIEKWKDLVNWEYIFRCQILSEEFIEKYQNKIDDWSEVSTFQFLSEQFIEKYQNKIDWDQISLYQKLSSSFIEKWKDKINLKRIKQNLLIQSDIGRDWFIAYTNIHSIYNEQILLNLHHTSFFNAKIKVFYKDLERPVISNKIKYIREVNKYKICGKSFK